MPEFAELLKGYERFRKDIYPRQQARFDQTVAEGQHPKLMIIGCSDSRVDPAQIFDVDPGDIFVLRNVAALVPPFEKAADQPEAPAAIEFAVRMLEVKQVVVMGHGRCGGCKAALAHSFDNTEPGSGGLLSGWLEHLSEPAEAIGRALGREGKDAERAMELAAVRQSLANLRSYPFIKEAEDAGHLKLRGAHFAIPDGVLYSLDEETGDFEPLG